MPTEYTNMSGSGFYQPTEMGTVAMTLDPCQAGTAVFAPAAGSMWVWRCKVALPVASALRTVGYSLSTVGATLTNSFFGVYQFNGSNFALLGAGSSDQSAALSGSTGTKTAQVGTFGLNGTDIYIGLVIGTATTLPKLSCSAGGVQLVNDNWPTPGLNSPVARFMSGGAGLSALPATLDSAGITWANAQAPYARLT